MSFVRTRQRPTFKQIKSKAAKADEGMRRVVLREMRQLGRAWVRMARVEAPQGKTGKYKASIGWKVFPRGDIVTMKGHRGAPLGTFITKGTKPHWIQARNRLALAFFWPKVGMMTIVPKRGGFATHARNNVLWIGKGGVDHPGTKPNPYHKRAYRKWKPQARKALRKMTTTWRDTFVS